MLETLSRPGGLRAGLKAVDRAWLAVGLILLGIALVDVDRLGHFVGFALSQLIATAPFILFAVAMVAYLKASGAERVLARAFEGRESRMIVLAALVGGLAPFCSCQVIPFVAALLALGTPLSAVMAFWLSSPLIDPPTLLVTAAALGWPFAAGKAVAAVGIGLLGGFVIKAAVARGRFADPARPAAPSGCGCRKRPGLPEGRPAWRFWREPPRRAAFAAEARANGLFLVKWLTLAYLLEGLLIETLPAATIARVVGGDGVLSVVVAALVGGPAYLNSYAAPPLVAGLMQQGMSAGAGMAFIVAGAVSSMPAMVAVFALVRRRVFAAYVGLGVLGAVLSGLAYGLVAGG